MSTAYQRLTKPLKKRWRSLFRVAKSVNNVAVLSARQIYILPSRWSLFYFLMLLALLIGAINYTLSLAYFVTFLLAALANVAMLHTWRNLAYLQVSIGTAKPVFAGNSTNVNITIRNLKNRTRYAIFTAFESNMATPQSISANQSTHFQVPLTTHKRGYLIVPRLKLHTEFPLSLFYAWAVIDNAKKILVYPTPKGEPLPQLTSIEADKKGKQPTLKGDEDFFGHKSYQIGDLPSKVDWKASSRGIGMFSKQYAGEGAANLHLDWAQTTGDTETRISQLTRWVIDAHDAKLSYGLKLNKQVQLTADNTEQHYHACLKALALK